MQTDSVTAVKLFVCWCYQERLQSIKPNASFKELEKWKVALIDLWIFAARYDIPKLQNQTMKALLALDLPQLLSKEDIRYVWDRTLSRSDALRDLAARVMVAQIEESSGQQKTIQDFKDVEGLDGLLAMVYTAHGKWLTYEMPRTKKDKRTKWMVFTQDPRVRQAFMVEERTQEVPQPQTKRRRTDGEAGPGLSGFPQVEVIEID